MAGPNPESAEGGSALGVAAEGKGESELTLEEGARSIRLDGLGGAIEEALVSSLGRTLQTRLDDLQPAPKSGSAPPPALPPRLPSRDDSHQEE